MPSEDFDTYSDPVWAEAPEDFGEEIRLSKSVEEYRAARTQRAAARRRSAKINWRLVVPVCAVLLLLGALVAGDYLFSLGKIHGNVEVAGIAVGGKTRTQAKELLGTTLAGYMERPVPVSHEDKDWEIAPEAIGLSWDTQGAVDDAWSVGRSDNVLLSLRDRFMCWFKPNAVAIESTSDAEKTEAEFEPLRKAINVEPVDSRVEYADGAYAVIVGSDGVMLNEVRLVELISDVVLNQQGGVEAPAELAVRAISDENAGIAAQVANHACAEPVIVTFEDKGWKLEPKDIVALLEFKRSDALEDGDALLVSEESSANAKIWLGVLVSSDLVKEKVIPRVGADVGVEAVDAKFSVKDGTVKIVPSQNGSGVDAVQLATDLAGILVLDDEMARRVEMVTNEIEPKLTTEKAQSYGIKERISTFTTRFPSGNAPRVNNIKLLAKSLNGALVAPGDLFSFNGQIGERTAAKGYQEAGAIVKGEIVQQIGGGICQVNTTLFNAALLSGVKITQRQNHSTYLSQYPLGRDATVSWGGPDFKFENNFDNYILIATSVSSGSVTVSFYGVDPGYTVSLETGPFKRTDFNTREIKDPSLKEGKREVETKGQRGGSVLLTQTIKKDGAVVRTATFPSRYNTVTEVVRIGTKKVAEQPPATPGVDPNQQPVVPVVPQ